MDSLTDEQRTLLQRLRTARPVGKYMAVNTVTNSEWSTFQQLVKLGLVAHEGTLIRVVE